MELDRTALLHKIGAHTKFGKIVLGVLAVAIIVGVLTGRSMASGNGGVAGALPGTDSQPTAKSANQDTHTFRDFAEGTLTKKPTPKAGVADYSEGTHILVRENAVSVALTSSVVDLSQYEGKKVKVYGETQKAIKEGWLMDVGKVEEIK